jgi:hypothetical protein
MPELMGLYSYIHLRQVEGVHYPIQAEYKGKFEDNPFHKNKRIF